MIIYHPKRGSILICDFDSFTYPEMTKRRPVIVLSEAMKTRDGLCTIVALSTTEPYPVAPYHCQITFTPPLPPPYDSPTMWVKGDMLYTLSFKRFCFPFIQKDDKGQREYDERVISPEDMEKVEECVCNGLAIAY